MENAFIIILFGFCGLFIGSLITYFAHRIPLKIITHWQQNSNFVSDEYKKFSLPLLSPSICPHCYHRLSIRSLIPIYSWWQQRGLCCYCQQAISPIYPLTELITALLFMSLASANHDVSWLLILLFITSLLITATLIDAAHQLLPDVLTLPLMGSGIIAALAGYSPLTLPESVSGALFGYLLLWLPAVIFKLMCGVDGLGGGDIKLMAGFGAWLGANILPIVMLAASFSALIFMLLFYKKIHRKHHKNKDIKNRQIAFGPFIAIVGWLALLKDPFIIDLSILFQALL